MTSCNRNCEQENILARAKCYFIILCTSSQSAQRLSKCFVDNSILPGLSCKKDLNVLRFSAIWITVHELVDPVYLSMGILVQYFNHRIMDHLTTKKKTITWILGLTGIQIPIVFLYISVWKMEDRKQTKKLIPPWLNIFPW